MAARGACCPWLTSASSCASDEDIDALAALVEAGEHTSLQELAHGVDEDEHQAIKARAVEAEQNYRARAQLPIRSAWSPACLTAVGGDSIAKDADMRVSPLRIAICGFALNPWPAMLSSSS